MARTVLPKNFKLGRGFTGDARATSGVGTVVGAPPAQDARTGALARARDASLDSTLREYSRARERAGVAVALGGHRDAATGRRVRSRRAERVEKY